VLEAIQRFVQLLLVKLVTATPQRKYLIKYVSLIVSGNCYTTNFADGTPCDDGNLCTTGDTCNSGSCNSIPVLCSAIDQCHNAGTCNPLDGSCSTPTKSDNAACDDGNLCTVVDKCISGVCQGFNTTTCFAQDQCHDIGACDPLTGYCSNPAKIDGTSCNDGLLCTDNDVCTSGLCGGTTHVCSPVPPCPTAGVCAPNNGVSFDDMKLFYIMDIILY
jgi:hypothetical protein